MLDIDIVHQLFTNKIHGLEYIRTTLLSFIFLRRRGLLLILSPRGKRAILHFPECEKSSTNSDTPLSVIQNQNFLISEKFQFYFTRAMFDYIKDKPYYPKPPLAQ